MSKEQHEICAPARPHTGVVWSARLKKPGSAFLRDFSWVCYDTENPQINRPFSAYMMMVHDDGDLEIRFNDHSHPPIGADAKVTVSIRHPNSE